MTAVMSGTSRPSRQDALGNTNPMDIFAIDILHYNIKKTYTCRLNMHLFLKYMSLSDKIWDQRYKQQQNNKNFE